jgi:prevent-host-death family protein
MNKLPQMASIADIRNHHLSVLAMLKQGPVLISSRSKPVAVMITPALWDSIAEKLDEAADIIDALEEEVRMLRGERKTNIMTPAEVDAWLTEEDEDAQTPANDAEPVLVSN